MNATLLRFCFPIAFTMAFPVLADDYTGPIIDAHAHIRFGDKDVMRSDQPIGTTELRKLNQASGISKSALIVMTGSGDMAATRAKNDSLIRAVKLDSAHFYAVASVHPADGEEALVELKRLADLGVKQIKLHPNSQEFDVADPAVARITERCGQLGLVVLFDSYNPLDPGQTGKLLALSMKQPNTKFVLAHMTFSQFRETAAFALLRKLGASKNVWFDISAIAVFYAGSPAEAELVWTMRQVGMDRIIFGSDWPTDSPATAIAAVRQLKLDSEEQKRVFHDNVVELLGLHESTPH